jgi:predicted ATPase
LTGEVLWGSTAPSEISEAERWFGRALESARHQHAKWFELKAVTSLSRVLQKKGRQNEAHARLAEVCGWFTEGFDTPVFQEAQALLSSVS